MGRHGDGSGGARDGGRGEVIWCVVVRFIVGVVFAVLSGAWGTGEGVGEVVGNV